MPLRTLVLLPVVLLCLLTALAGCQGESDTCACSLPATHTSEVYVVFGAPDSKAVLRAEAVEVRSSGPTAEHRAEDAVEALIEWRPDREADIRNGWQLIPGEPIAEVRSVTHRKDVVVVDLDRAVWDPYPTYDLEPIHGHLAMQQLVWTVWAALDTHDPVLLTIRDTPARGLWFHPLDGPVSGDRSVLGPGEEPGSGQA